MKRELNGGTAFMMAMIAFFIVDTTHAIFGFFWLGFLADILGTLIFWPWLSSHGINMFSGKTMGKTWGTFIVAALPFTFFIPAWTIYIIALYVSKNTVQTRDIIGEADYSSDT